MEYVLAVLALLTVIISGVAYLLKKVMTQPLSPMPNPDDFMTSMGLDPLSGSARWHEADMLDVTPHERRTSHAEPGSVTLSRSLTRRP